MRSEGSDWEMLEVPIPSWHETFAFPPPRLKLHAHEKEEQPDTTRRSYIWLSSLKLFTAPLQDSIVYQIFHSSPQSLCSSFTIILCQASERDPEMPGTSTCTSWNHNHPVPHSKPANNLIIVHILFWKLRPQDPASLHRSEILYSK
uniref:Uncharacterized protein n=1 Tax=Salix viminalis TaxID=40686 RepID=A0A6N2MUE2_SALVM